MDVGTGALGGGPVAVIGRAVAHRGVDEEILRIEGVASLPIDG